MAIQDDVYKARNNGFSTRQYVPPGQRPINVDEVMQILVNASETSHIGVRRAAHALLEAMARYVWHITAARHTGGHGNTNRSPDENEHITISIHGKGYHLQLTRQGHLRRVTGDDGVELVPPWLSPGAPIPNQI